MFTLLQIKYTYIYIHINSGTPDNLLTSPLKDNLLHKHDKGVQLTNLLHKGVQLSKVLGLSFHLHNILFKKAVIY